jgi:hypothetical protein
MYKISGKSDNELYQEMLIRLANLLLKRTLIFVIIYAIIAKNGDILMEKIWSEMYEAAMAVLNERRISEYVTCGEVAAAILAKSGKIRSISLLTAPVLVS